MANLLPDGGLSNPAQSLRRKPGRCEAVCYRPASAMEWQEPLVRHAIELARQARAAGNHPFGALLAIDGDVVLTAQNTVHTDGDPTAHAETNLVALAVRQLSPTE